MAPVSKKTAGRKRGSENPEGVFAGEIAPRPIRRKAAIPAYAVEKLLPRYNGKKAREFAEFLMEFEESPVSAAMSHPVFAIRLSDKIDERKKQKEKRFSVITGEQIRACRRGNVADGIKEALSQKHESHVSVNEVHFKRTKRWARLVESIQLYLMFGAFLPVYELGWQWIFGTGKLPLKVSIGTIITMTTFLSAFSAMKYYLSTKMDEMKNKKRFSSNQDAATLTSQPQGYPESGLLS